MPPCKYGDPFCPCQDGDLCHYEGPNPMTPPKPLETIPCDACDREVPYAEIIECSHCDARVCPKCLVEHAKGHAEL
jgi:hypothetical protein